MFYFKSIKKTPLVYGKIYGYDCVLVPDEKGYTVNFKSDLSESRYQEVDTERYDIVEKNSYKKKRLEQELETNKKLFEISESSVKQEEQNQKILAKKISDIEKELKDLDSKQ